MQKKTRLVLGLSALVIVASLVMVVLLQTLEPKQSILPDNNQTIKETTGTENKSDREIFDANKAINKDYIGELRFESGLIDFPVLQGESNDTYITTDWTNMEYDIEGSIFLDYRNNYESDQNLVIYGHYVYADESRKFGPLHQLKEEKNYESNKYIELILENEVRRYEIAYVYYCELTQDELGNWVYTRDDMQYYHTNFEDADYFDVYQEAMKTAQFYRTGVEITQEDKLLTLQTCVRNRDDLRLIVVAKEIERNAY